MSEVSAVPRLALLCLGLAFSPTLSPPAHGAPAGAGSAGSARADAARSKRLALHPRKAAEHFAGLPAERQQEMRWEADTSRLGKATRAGNQLQRKGRIEVSLPGLDGRGPRSIQATVKERVGAGSGPAVTMDLSDPTSGQTLSLALDAEMGTLQISAGGGDATVRLLPDGALQVDGKRCSSASDAVEAFASALPAAFELEPELVAAMFSVPGSPEAGDKMVWETIIAPLMTVFKQWLKTALGETIVPLIEFLEFWFADTWLSVYCGIDPGSCEAFADSAGL